MLKIKYPIGIQNFERLRSEDFLYIDKTQLIKKLVEDGCYYFLSRPRRFGKSLFLSTIQAYFEGKRELFKGLAIDSDEMDWEARPVLKLDLNAEKYDSVEALESILRDNLSRWERTYGSDTEERSLPRRFESVIRCAHLKTGRTVAILVDEYDKPMLQAIGKPDLADTYREILKAFYGVMKSCDQHIKFAFLTGVTKFSKVSIFSDLNNIEDITLVDEYSAICGITEEEIHSVLE